MTQNRFIQSQITTVTSVTSVYGNATCARPHARARNTPRPLLVTGDTGDTTVIVEESDAACHQSAAESVTQARTSRLTRHELALEAHQDSKGGGTLLPRHGAAVVAPATASVLPAPEAVAPERTLPASQGSTPIVADDSSEAAPRRRSGVYELTLGRCGWVLRELPLRAVVGLDGPPRGPLRAETGRARPHVGSKF